MLRLLGALLASLLVGTAAGACLATPEAGSPPALRGSTDAASGASVERLVDPLGDPVDEASLDPANLQPAGPESLERPTDASSTPAPAVTVPAPFLVPEPAARTRLRRVPAAFADLLRGLADQRGGTYGLVVEQVATGERFELNARRVFPAASVYKLAVAYGVLRQVDAGRLTLDDLVAIEPRDAVEPEPAGGLNPGDEVTIRDTLEAMMGVSSNAAAHALLRLVGRPQLNDTLAGLGLRQTRVPLSEAAESTDGAEGAEGAGLMAGSDAAAPSDAAATDAAAADVAVTTPADMARLVRLLSTGRLLRPDSWAEMQRLLAIEEELDPVVVSLPAGAGVLLKVGNLEDASNAAGLLETSVGPLILSVFDEGVDPGDARAFIADVARAAYALYQR